MPAGELKASCSSALNQFLQFLSADHLDPSFCQRVYGLYSYKNQGWGTPKDDFERQVDEVRSFALSSTRRFLVPPRAHSTTSYQNCLQVNIWTPVGPPPKDGWPVLFYIREFLQPSAIVNAVWLTRLVRSSVSSPLSQMEGGFKSATTTKDAGGIPAGFSRREVSKSVLSFAQPVLRSSALTSARPSAPVRDRRSRLPTQPLWLPRLQGAH